MDLTDHCAEATIAELAPDEKQQRGRAAQAGEMVVSAGVQESKVVAYMENDKGRDQSLTEDLSPEGKTCCSGAQSGVAKQ